MKKAYLLIVLLAVCAAAMAVEVTHTGRVLMEMVYENNWNDWTNWDETDAPTSNDADTYGKGRVDVGFNVVFNENVMAKVAFRGEGDDTNNKWMYWGKNNIAGGQQLADAEMTLQEAYITFKGLFHQPLQWDLGRKTYNYGAKNIVSDADKLDGWRLKYDADMFNVALHYFIRERNPIPQDDEYDADKTLMGVYVGFENDMMDLAGYFWMQSMSQDADNKESTNVFGARGEFTLMEGMIMPFVEFAMESGTDEAADVDNSGMLIDLGSKFMMDMGSGKLDACIEYLASSGQDADETDGTVFNGVGLSNREEGYKLQNPAAGGLAMIKLEAGFTPAAMDALRINFDFWMFNDNTKNYDNTSGENIYNEIELGGTWKWAKNIKTYAKLNMGMPNEDMAGEDSALAFTVGSQVKW